MSETAANTYATDASNAPAVTPNKVAVDIDTAGNERQVVQIGDKTSNNVSVFPATFLRTSDEPRQLLYDPFDGTLDTTNTWTATIANSAVLASNTTGAMSLGTGTTANGWSKLVSQPSFKPTVPAWIGYSFLNIIPDLAAPTVNATRFFGSGTPATTPTTSAVMTDGIGFELVDTKMNAVYYAGGVRTVIQDLSAATGNATQPTDANGHRYIIYIRTDKVYFYIDGLAGANLVATGNFTYPNVQTAPMSFVTVGGATPPASNAQIKSIGATVWDTGKNNTQLSDGTYPWRKQTVDSGGNAYVTNTRFNGGKLFQSGTLNTAGDNVVITPAAGKQITVYWVALVPNSDNSAANLCQFKFGAAGSPFYTQYAIAHWEPFQGAVNATVIINLTNTQPVSYTIHYTTT